jgi:hypothetical protein
MMLIGWRDLLKRAKLNFAEEGVRAAARCASKALPRNVSSSNFPTC